MKIVNNKKMTIKNKASILLLILFSIFSQSFFYRALPWFNLKIGIAMTSIAFVSMLVAVFTIEKSRKSIYIIMGIALLFLLAQFFIK